MAGNAGKMHCRLHHLRFVGEHGPNFDDICVPLGGRCHACVYPGQPGAARLALTDEDMEFNVNEPARAMAEGFYVGICSTHAKVVFDRAVMNRACQAPSCNPEGESEAPKPGLGVSKVGDERWCDACCTEYGVVDGDALPLVLPLFKPPKRLPTVPRSHDASANAGGPPQRECAG